MMPESFNNRRSLRERVSILFGIAFLLASLRWIAQGWVTGGEWGSVFTDSRFWLVGPISILFFLSLKFPRIRLVEPYVFLIIAVIPFLGSPESVYGFGLAAVGAILLFVDGQLSHRTVLKLSLLGAYLLVLVIGSAVVSSSTLEAATGVLLSMTGFFLFFFLTFQDKIVVFVKESKPVVRLSGKKFSVKESEHLLALLAGKSTKEIAWEQGVRESTVRNSLSRAYHKLGFTDKTQVLQWAESHDIRP